MGDSIGGIWGSPIGGLGGWQRGEGAPGGGSQGVPWPWGGLLWGGSKCLWGSLWGGGVHMFRGVPEGGALGGYKGLLGGDLEILLLEDWGVLPCRGAVRWTPVGGGEGRGGSILEPPPPCVPPSPPRRHAAGPQHVGQLLARPGGLGGAPRKRRPLRGGLGSSQQR